MGFDDRQHLFNAQIFQAERTTAAIAAFLATIDARAILYAQCDCDVQSAPDASALPGPKNGHTRRPNGGADMTHRTIHGDGEKALLEYCRENVQARLTGQIDRLFATLVDYCLCTFALRGRTD